VIALVFGLYLLYLIRGVLLLVFVVLILVAALRPIIKKWEKSIGRPLSILSIFLIILAITVGFIYLIIPPLVEQSRQLITNIPDYLDKVSILRSHFPAIEKGLSAITDSAGQLTGRFLSITANIFNGIVAFFTVIILTIYSLIDEKRFLKFAQSIIPNDKKDYVLSLSNKVSEKIGDWLGGQIILGFVIGILSFLGLSIIGLPYALTLAVIAGLLEIVPIVGPIISGILAALVALTVSPITAIIVVVFFIVLQQIENNFLVPKIMQKALGLPPAIIILAILIGGKLLGIIGGLLAVPVAGVLYLIVQEWQTVRKITGNDDE
jgi:predicted PurR-regulated permease PerM